MGTAYRGRAVALGLVLAWCPGAWALDPALDVSQYAHTAWKIREGFTKGTIVSIAQTPDGYLWLGTEFGLLRFDGVRNVPWQPPPGQHLPSTQIWSLLAVRDGSVQCYGEDGTFGHGVFGLYADSKGNLWAGVSYGLWRWKPGPPEF